MPSYVFTYRQPKDQPLNMDEARAWFKWFDEIGEHITDARLRRLERPASSATSTAASASAASP